MLDIKIASNYQQSCRPLKQQTHLSNIKINEHWCTTKSCGIIDQQLAHSTFANICWTNYHYL